MLRVSPGAVVAGPARVIEVRRPGLAGYLDRPAIVAGTNGYRVDLNQGARWAEPLGDMVGRVLAQDLAQRLPGSTVYAEGGAISGGADLRVELDIQHFDADAAGGVRLQGALVLERGHVVVATRQLDVRGGAAGGGAAGVAAGMSEVLGGVADLVVGEEAGGR